MGLVSSIQSESGSIFFVSVKKIQEMSLLLKVRDVVAVANHLLIITGMAGKVSVSDAILSENEGATNTGGNNRQTGGDKMRYQI